MSREYARRSRGGGGNLPLIIAIIGTVIVIAVILYFLLGSGENSIFGPKETPTPEVTSAPPTQTNTPGPSLTVAPSQTMALIVSTDTPTVAIATQTSTPTPPPSYADARITAISLNVREGPGLDYNKVGSVKYGERYKVYEEASKFLKIQMSNGVFGWIWRSYTVRGDAALPPKPTSEPKPSFMSKAEFTGSNTIRVTFTENVWGNSGKTDNVPATVFTVKEGTASITITAITPCAGGKYVDLTVGNTSGGSITVSLAKNGVYNTDGEGTPAGSYTIGTSSDTVVPTVTNKSLTNKVVTFTFSENIGSATDGTGSLDSTDFYVSGGYSVAIVSVTSSGNTATITLSFTGMSSGNEAICALTLYANSAYDGGGNACAQTAYNFTYKEP